MLPRGHGQRWRGRGGDNRGRGRGSSGDSGRGGERGRGRGSGEPRGERGGWSGGMRGGHPAGHETRHSHAPRTRPPYLNAIRGAGSFGSDRTRPRKIPSSRKAPEVFTKERLMEYLRMEPNDVIMTLSTLLKKWNEFVSSEAELTLESGLLTLVLQILGDKICSHEVTLSQQQTQILTSTTSSLFQKRVVEYCNRVAMGLSLAPAAEISGDVGVLTTSDLPDVDSSPVTFLTNLFLYCSFVCNKMPETSVDYLQGVITAALTAIISSDLSSGKQWEDLQNDFRSLKTHIGDLVKTKERKERLFRPAYDYFLTEGEQRELHAMEAPEDYRDIPVIPSVKELLSKEEVFLRPNIAKGAYHSSSHYLDVQFRLLREDFVRPLREGIQDFMKHRNEYLSRHKRLPNGSVRIYPDIYIVHAERVRDSYVYKAQLPDNSYRRVKWEKSKRLMSGSLVVFTADFFRTAYFGIISFRNVEELQKGILSFTWVGTQPPWNRNLLYLMIECEIFFEPYRHTLETLKVLTLEQFPMRKFIVDGSSEVESPVYLNEDEKVMTVMLKNKSNKNFHPKNIEEWPSSDELGLDANQFRAFQAALTSQFVIIQGPPGTGKTFLGLKIAEALLRNSNLWKAAISDGPIFVVCYTNHALDQFLEGILDIMRNKLDLGKGKNVGTGALIRVGGRSRSDELQNEFSLRNVTRSMRDKHMLPSHYINNENEARWEVRRLQECKENLLVEIQALRNLDGIFNWRKLEVFKELENMFPPVVLKYLSSPGWLTDKSEKPSNDTDANKIVSDWFEFEFNPKSTIDLNLDMWKIETYETEEQEEQENVQEDPDIVEEDYDVQEILDQRMIEDLHIQCTSGKPSGELKDGLYLNNWSIKECQSLSRKLIKELDDQYNNRLAVATNFGERELHFIDKRMGHLNEEIQIVSRKEEILRNLFMEYRNGRLKIPNMQDFIKIIEQKLTSFDSKEDNEDVEKLNTQLEAWGISASELKSAQLEVKKEVASMLEVLNIRKRWGLYFTVLEAAKNLCPLKLSSLDNQLLSAEKKLSEIQRCREGLALKSAKVVGMTTTGAAKYHDLVKMMRAKIVIVEEAAEVLESHIVTCISNYCEHLVLIGDHLQLRPSTTVHQLAKQYKLEISLFERMLNNELSCYRLKMQHRMRPEIANLVVGTVYDELENHDSVTKYPNVLGMSKNLFFLNHSQPEKADTESRSKSNTFEARYVVSLCKHLLAQGYIPDQITILTTYTGQMFLIKKVVNEMLDCRVKVTCVDNYQGEENDIILLSLVRSNPEGNIGFLKVDNRVCVALSRAKIGLYILGNMKILCEKSKIWPKINEKLLARDEIGPRISIKCQVHETLMEIKDEGGFQFQAPMGGCLRDCDTDLACGHKCTLGCHVLDREHKKYKCQQPCPKKCPNDHPCQDMCFRHCPPCRFYVEKTLRCLHIVKLPCSRDVETYQCLEDVNKMLLCGHEEQLQCWVDPQKFQCNVESVKELPCTHKRKVKCHMDLASVTCKTFVDKLLPCGHVENVECWKRPEDIRCQTMVTKELQDCHHQMEVKCCDKEKTSWCKELCKAVLDCGHLCPKYCHMDKDPKHLEHMCRQPCKKQCGGEGQHECSSGHMCHEKCPPCKVKVKRILEGCYHLAEMNCSFNYLAVKCKQDCNKTLQCGHKCPKMCSEPCGECKVNKLKLIKECGHEANVPCSQIPNRSMCGTLVRPLANPTCGHSNVLVPCNISDQVSGDELTSKYCTELCSTESLECGHKCQGTCKSCVQGSFHIKCAAECGKKLICGHICKSACSTSCPPCMEKCFLGCEHTQCKSNCFSACKPCKQKCPWQCEHQQCSKPCSDLCDRDPCNESCKLSLPCDHPCIGFCGEPCPLVCKVCNEQELHVADPDSHFVLLTDCNHTVEANTLLAHFNTSANQAGMLTCPVCFTVITRCRRFNNLIKSRIAAVHSIKAEILKNQNDVKELQSILINKIQAIDNKKTETAANIFPAFYAKLTSMVCNKTAKKNKRGLTIGFKYSPLKLEGPVFESILFLFELAFASAELLQDNQRTLQEGHYAQLKELYIATFDKQLLHLRPPLGIAEIQDIHTQLERLHAIGHLFTLKSSPQFFLFRNTVRPLYYQALELILSNNNYNSCKNRMEDLSQKLETTLETFGVEYQRLEIPKIKYGHQQEL